MSCNFNAEPKGGPDTTLCIIPTQAKSVVEDPVGLEKKPNVMSQWLDRLTAAGLSILLMHGEWFDSFQKLADALRSGRDALAMWQERIDGVVEESLRRGFGNRGRIILMGSSRHGFAVLHAMARNKEVSAAVAHQPVIWWPRFPEFVGMQDDPFIKKHDLYQWTDQFPPRPLLIQTGYDDERAGTDCHQRFILPMADLYRAHGAEDRFTHELMDLPGHDGTRVPDSSLDSVVSWLAEQGFLSASQSQEARH